MLKEIFILAGDLAGIISLILIIVFWFFIFPKYTKRVALLSDIIIDPEKETLKKELIEQCEETAKLNLEVCDEFKYKKGFKKMSFTKFFLTLALCCLTIGICIEFSHQNSIELKIIWVCIAILCFILDFQIISLVWF